MNSDEVESDKLDGVPHPRFTKQVLGQDKFMQQFLHAFHGNRSHHAWLACGPRGIGKSTLSWQLAKFLLTRNLQEENNGSCLKLDFNDPVITRIETLSEPHLMLVRKNYDIKTKKIKSEITIDSIRDLVNFFEFTSPDGRPRIAIIDSIDDLNVNASNAFLKLLEEPPEHSYFFLISHSPESLLPTIRSRCLSVKCQKLSNEDQLHLLNKFNLLSNEKTKKVVSISQGSVGEAVRIINQNGLQLYTAIVTSYMDLPRFDIAQILKIAAQTEGVGKQELTETINRLTIHFVSRLVKVGVTEGMMSEIFAGENQILRKLSPNFEKSYEWSNLYSQMVANAQSYKESKIDGFSQVFENLQNIKKAAIN